MDRLSDWTASAGAKLGVDAGQADTDEILELAMQVQRAEGKPAAVMAAYLLGVAVGRGVEPKEAVALLADLTRERSDTTCDWRD
jgi:hypothetical protein